MNICTSSLLFLLFLFANPSLATNYYVSTSGSDAAIGSLAAPFATVQHGANQLTPGDSLLIRGGSYFEKIYLNVSGSAGMPITICNYQNEIVTLDGTGVVGLEMFTIHQQSYLSLSGIIFQNNYGQYTKGIFVSSEASNIEISNCTIRNIGWSSDATADPYSVSPTGQANGILVNGRTTIGVTQLSITDCDVYDIVSGNSEAVTLVGNVRDFELLRDSVYDTTNIGIVVAGHYSYAIDSGVDPALNQSRDGEIVNCVTFNNRRISNIDAPAGIYADGAARVLIKGNTSYQNGNGLSVGCENAGFTADSIIVVDNVIYNNDNQGMYFGSNAASISKCTLKNNTFLHNGSIGNFYSEIALQNSENCLITQNIFLPRTISHYAVSIFGYTVTSLVVDNNLAYRYDGTTANLYVPGSPSQFTATNSLTVNPLLIDTTITSPDFHLSSLSPAIDRGLKGYSVISDKDYYLDARVVNGKLDLGATEHLNGGCPQSLTIDDTMILSGQFIAQDSLLLNLLGGSFSDSTILNAPEIEILSECKLIAELLVSAQGCTN